jgi:hypothetical protein
MFKNLHQSLLYCGARESMETSSIANMHSLLDCHVIIGQEIVARICGNFPASLSSPARSQHDMWPRFFFNRHAFNSVSLMFRKVQETFSSLAHYSTMDLEAKLHFTYKSHGLGRAKARPSSFVSCCVQ